MVSKTQGEIQGALGALSCQTAASIGTNFGSRLRIHLEMDIG